MRIFTWHIHGSYLYYLSQGNFDIYIPVDEKKTTGYYGRGETFHFGENVIEVPVREVKAMDFDLILFQSHQNYLEDQYKILSERQRNLPSIFLEHDPPWGSPADTIHPVKDPAILTVHVSHYNRLMWHNIGPARVIDHGVTGPAVPYKGDLERGLVIVNNLHTRGRKLGADIFEKVKHLIPLDLAGMGTKEFGGLGEVMFHDLTEFSSRYRFFFNPIRYTSLGLAFCEAMRSSIPVVCLATTEYASVIQNGINGFSSNNIDYLVEKMNLLLENKELAVELGQKGKETADKLFNIQRFRKDWEETITYQIQQKKPLYEKENSTY